MKEPWETCDSQGFKSQKMEAVSWTRNTDRRFWEPAEDLPKPQSEKIQKMLRATVAIFTHVN